MPSAVHSELATEWATNFGLTTTELFHPIDQITLIGVLKRFWTGIRGADEGTLCSFSSRFLPSLVAAYKSMPAADGAYAVMLRRTMNDPYFVKFIRSQMGADLFVFHAQQAINTNGWRTLDPLIMSDSMTLLSYLVIYSHQYLRTVQQLPTAEVHQLIAVLGSWMAMIDATRVSPTPFWCDRVNYIVNPDIEKKDQNDCNSTSRTKDFAHCFRSSVGRKHCAIARRLLSEQLSLDDALKELHEYIPWVMCAACWHDGDEIIMIKKRHRLSCGRCLATVYCCAEHQQDDWHEQHRPACFQTTW